MTSSVISLRPSLNRPAVGDQNTASLLTSKLRDHDLPKLVTLEDNLHAACFSVIKLLAARAIIEQAVAQGKIVPGTHVVESTSGTFGLALAMLKSYYGYELTVVSDPVIDTLLKTRLEQLGAEVSIVESPQDGSYQMARLARVREIMASKSNAFFTDQYNNPVNTWGYARLADYLAARFPRIDCLVGTVGTGGSLCGTAARLRHYFPKLKVVGVDTHNSVIFGQPNGPRTLRGLGNSLVPGNVDHTCFDEVHWVSATEAYRASRSLHSDKGLFMGGTSGAAYQVAKWHAAANTQSVTVTLFPDEGHRYIDTIYNDDYVSTLPGWNTPTANAPEDLHRPDLVTGGWSRFAWKRRTMKQVQEDMDVGY